MATPSQESPVQNIAIASISTSSSGRHRIAWIPVDAGERIESLLPIEGGPLFVESCVIAFDVAQVTGGAHDVLPSGALRLPANL